MPVLNQDFKRSCELGLLLLGPCSSPQARPRLRHQSMKDHVERSRVSPAEVILTSWCPADPLADHQCMRKPRGAEPKAAKTPSWAVSLWPKMNVYCYKLRFWGHNCSALLWPEITDEASAILVMLSSTLSPVTLLRLPGEGTLCISVMPKTGSLPPPPWALWVQPLSEAADSLHSHPELDTHIGVGQH